MDSTSPTACFIRHSYFPKDVRVMKQAKTLHEAGFSVDIICLREEGQAPVEVIDGIHIHRVMATHKRGSTLRYMLQYAVSFLMMAVMVAWLHIRRRYSIIQVVTMPDFLVFVTLFPKLLGAKIMLDLQEPIPELWMTKFGRSLPIVLKGLILTEQWAIRYADGAVTVNDTIRKRFIERGAPEWKIGLSRNVPDDRVIRIPAAQRQNGPFTIMTHGTIEEHYGHETIIEAMKLMKEKIKNIHLLIIGDGKFKQRLVALVDEYSLSDFVTFKQWLPYDEIPLHIAQADAGIIPRYASPFAELCQPLKLFDYIALKKPVVATRFKAIEESFDDNCIRYIPPNAPEAMAAAVEELYLNPEKGKTLAENAYKIFIASLKWEKAKIDYLKCIRRLTDQRMKGAEKFSGSAV